MSSIRPPCIIDVEASGFGPDSYPIEIGIALGGGEKYCTLITPAETWVHWDESAEEVHRIPRDILAEYGKPLRQVAEEVNDVLQNRTVYTDGWVVDAPWINKLYDSSRLSKDFHVSALDMILSERQMELWHPTKDEIFASMDLKRHRASYDAFLIQTTWVKTKEIELEAATLSSK